jgi:hypothetical protein
MSQEGGIINIKGTGTKIGKGVSGTGSEDGVKRATRSMG